MNSIDTASNLAILPVSRTCSTANSTFPPYSSLSVCSLVANVTDRLKMIQSAANNNNKAMSASDFIHANLTLPNGVWMLAGEVLLKTQTPTCESNEDHFEYEMPETNRSASLEFAPLPGIDSAMSNFFVLYQTFLSDTTPKTYYYRAIEVLLHWCVNVYSTAVAAGKATTQIVNSSRNVLSLEFCSAIPCQLE
jgi:hypothetical protein